MPKPSDARDPKDRLLERICIDQETGCWNWTGCVRSTAWPYGRMTVGSRANGTRTIWPTHRLSYVLFKGEIPEGLLVCHKCDNPRCVNPEHLFLGTTKDNADDREAKGRNVLPPRWRGEKAPRAKLRDIEIAEIRASDLEHKELAAQYGVCADHIRLIRKNSDFRAQSHPGLADQGEAA